MLAKEQPLIDSEVQGSRPSPAPQCSPCRSADQRWPALRSRKQRLRRAVLLSFRDPLPAECIELYEVTKSEWRSLLHWLDVSGLALYFLDRLRKLQSTHILPEHVLARLQQNMRDNTERTHGMIAESIVVQEEFQASAVPYAVLKGFSLAPESVPSLELRHQFDLDFLIAEEAIAKARAVLERQGYRLYAVSGKSWEFKKEEKIGILMEDFYKDTSGRTVELHLQAFAEESASVLSRTKERDFYGIDMPILSPADLFLGQGMHAYKHICGEFSRASHLLEFYRHVITRHDDHIFWSEVRARGEGNPKVSLGLGVLTLLITTVMGEFAPVKLTEWTVDTLPPAVRLWVKLYGLRAVFGDVPGSKLYLLLVRELEPSGHAMSRSLWESLFPRRLPPQVVLAFEGESLCMRGRRYRIQVKYVLIRLRFHIVEGLRYSWAAYRWERHTEGLTR
jgi:Uncharacterised nucleotidyltransferase